MHVVNYSELGYKSHILKWFSLLFTSLTFQIYRLDRPSLI